MSWRITHLVAGYPGTSGFHGGLGWSSVSLIYDGEETVLVDTGPFSYREILDERLAAVGASREQIDKILLTHCHWDHISNVNLFPNATVFVGKSELEWASQQPVGTWFIPELQVADLLRSDRVVAVSGHTEILSGVRAFPTPGHTPGHMAFQVACVDSDAIFVGDAVKNLQEFESRNPRATLDLQASRRSIEAVSQRLRSRPGNILYCGHDVPGVFDGVHVRRIDELRASIHSYVGKAGHSIEWPLV